MDKLPKGWLITKLGNITNVKSSKRIFADEYVSVGIPFYRSKEIVELSKSDSTKGDLYISVEKYLEIKAKFGVPQEGDMLLTSVGTIGKTWIVDNREFYYKDGNLTQLEKNDNFDMKFIQYYFQSPLFTETINEKVTGTAYNALTIQKINQLEIPLPPLPEQTRIVNKLDRLFKRIDKSIALLEENIKHTETLMASVLDEIFSKINAKRFQVKALSKNIQYGYTGKALDKGEYYYLRITDIQNGKVNYSNTPYSDIPESQVDKYVLKHGDILFARTGATAGKSYLFNDNEKSVFASYLIRVVCNEKVLIPNYLYCFFQSKGYWDQIFGNIVGAAQPNE